MLDMQIIFNGSAIEAVADYMTYEDLAAMSGVDQPTITFAAGRHVGTLMPGRSVVLEDGMVIDVVNTGRA